MGSRTVRIDDDLYERIRRLKHEDESFSAAIDRLIDEVSLLDLAGNLSDAEAAEATAAIRTSGVVDRREARELGNRPGRGD